MANSTNFTSGPEAAHNYLAQAKAVLDVVILDADEGENGRFGCASKETTLQAIDAAVSLISLADREFRAAAA